LADWGNLVSYRFKNPTENFQHFFFMSYLIFLS
jgi:hypothetical protein